ncbi:MAG: hypothetical protein NZM05_12675, partial [Chloroherpetonaceae bacterium]|nr:hypothetical protein [Chloroherpetonaceae bacterium]
MNDEREISEPLLRRLPLIEFKPLPPLVVKKALELSHPNHPLIPSCVLLYEHTLVARLPKPATIQELRQLIDAADCLGENADWNELVFQFITKTRDAHEQLSLVQPSARYRSYEQLPVVDPNNYDSDNYNQDDEQEEHDSSPRMPSLSEIKNIHSSTSCPDETPEVTEHSGGILSLTDESYSAVVSMCEHPTS